MHHREKRLARGATLLTTLSVSFIITFLLITPSVPAAQAAQPIPTSRYFGNAYNSTESASLALTNSTQMVDVRFTARFGGTVVPRVYVTTDYYLPGAEYDVVIGIQPDELGMPSGHFLGAFVWNVSSGMCNSCGGWVFPGSAPKAQPLNHTITLVAGDVYHLVVKYFNGTFTNYPPLCYGTDCLLFEYIGGTNFQQESLDMHYDPNQAVLSCGNIGSCAIVSGANAVYALDYNGTTWVQGQTEGLVTSVGIGAAKGGRDLDSYQGERFWMSWGTLSVSRLQVLLSKIGSPTGSLNVLIWNFTAASARDILSASDPRLVLNQTLIENLSSMPTVVHQAFNFSLSENIVFLTGHLYQMSFAIYGNTTTVGGSNELRIAATSSFQLPNPLNWDGGGGSVTGACRRYPGGCAGFRYTGGTENNGSEADPSEDLIFIMKIASSAVVQPVSVTMSNSAPPANVTINGCYTSPSTFLSDGKAHLILAIPSCAFTLSFSNSGNTRDGFSVSESFTSMSSPLFTCATGTCPAIQLVAYQQLENTYQAKPVTPGAWDSNLAISVSGTQAGVMGQTGCSILAANHGGAASCVAWFDYRTEANVASAVTASATERWVHSGENNFTQTTGGNRFTVSFIDQFQVSFAVTPFGAGSTNPSGTKVWESIGPLLIKGNSNDSYIFDSWSADVAAITFASADNESTTAMILGAGNITAIFAVPVIQPVTLTLAEQEGSPANFTLSGCSVSPTSLLGDGKPHPLRAVPSCQLTITVSSDLPSVRYGFNLEGMISGTVLVTTCPGVTCSEFSATYYEQVGQQFAYKVAGGAAIYVKSPVLSYTALGAPATYIVTDKPTTQWLDFGSSWSLANPLSGSTVSERWFASSGTSGTAIAGYAQITTYQHQFAVIIEVSPVGCGSTMPYGTSWEDSDDSFQLTARAGPGCTFSEWEVGGLVTLTQQDQPSTAGFADSNGTVTASFSKNLASSFPTNVAIAVVVACAAAVIGVMLARSKFNGHRSPNELSPNVAGSNCVSNSPKSSGFGRHVDVGRVCRISESTLTVSTPPAR